MILSGTDLGSERPFVKKRPSLSPQPSPTFSNTIEMPQRPIRSDIEVVCMDVEFHGD
jgi:hypothetical protein